MRPSIDDDRFDISSRVKSARAEGAAELVACIALKRFEGCGEEFGPPCLVLLAFVLLYALVGFASSPVHGWIAPVDEWVWGGLTLGTFALIGDLAPGYYLTAVCVFSLWALITIRRIGADRYA